MVQASAEDIRLAYRKLVRRYHPDVSGEDDAEDRIREINEAYAGSQIPKDVGATIGSHKPRATGRNRALKPKIDLPPRRSHPAEKSFGPHSPISPND